MQKVWILPIIILAIFAGCSSQQQPQHTVDSKINHSIKPPEVFLQTNDKSSLNSIIGSYEWSKTEGNTEESATVDSDSPHILAKDIESTIVEPGEMVDISFESESKPTIYVYLWKDDGYNEEVMINENKLTLPTEQGRYIYEVFGEWPEGKASYIFVIEIK